MQTAPSPDVPLAERLRAMGISESYASQLANGRRIPPLKLALRIHREIGVKMGVLSEASASEIRVLAKVVGRSSDGPVA